MAICEVRITLLRLIKQVMLCLRPGILFFTLLEVMMKHDGPQLAASENLCASLPIHFYINCKDADRRIYIYIRWCHLLAAHLEEAPAPERQKPACKKRM